jgi:hypothetical protein
MQRRYIIGFGYQKPLATDLLSKNCPEILTF